MKKKLIAMVLTATLLGSVGSTAYAEVGTNGEEKSRNKFTSCNVDESSFKYISSESLKGVFNNLEKFIESILGINRPQDCPDNNGDNIQDDNENKPEENPENNHGNIGDETENNKPEGEVPEGEGVTPPVEEVIPPNNEEIPPVVDVIPPTNEEDLPPIVDKPEIPDVSDKFMAQVESKIFEKVKVERAKAGVSVLSYKDIMQKYARIKSQDMGDRGYFDHADPQGNLITVQMKNDGVSYRAWGENIAYIEGISDANTLADRFMTNWMNSPGHRQNILSNNFTGIGVGVYKIGNRVYATQEFYK